VATKRTRGPAPRRPAGGPKGAGGDGATRTKASTRAQREALLQAQARRERRARILRIGIPLLVVAGVAAFFLLKHTGSPTAPPTYVSVGANVDPDGLPGIQTGRPPWPPEEARLRQRLAAIGLPALSSEGNVLHIHQHLDLYVDGRPVVVPALIGINQEQGFLSPIHTHDTSGIVHVESHTRRSFTLGEFFDVWGVRFTRTCIGGLCNGGGKSLRVYADGYPVTRNPRQLALVAHEEIVVTFGTAAQVPNPIPKSYSFSFGL
jgi:hypothetical protein